jgi:hypothetical protein
MAITRTIAAASKTILLLVREAAMKADDNSGHQTRAEQGEEDSFSPTFPSPPEFIS